MTRRLRKNSGFDLNPVDRWGGTPLDDAYLNGNVELIDILEIAGAARGMAMRPSRQSPAAQLPAVAVDPVKTGELIWAASLGDLEATRRLVAQGIPLEAADYDSRTALHLAGGRGAHADRPVFS